MPANASPSATPYPRSRPNRCHLVWRPLSTRAWVSKGAAAPHTSATAPAALVASNLKLRCDVHMTLHSATAGPRFTAKPEFVADRAVLRRFPVAFAGFDGYGVPLQVDRNRPEIALAVVHPQRRQPARRRLVFDPLGDHPFSQRMREAGDGAHDGVAGGVQSNRSNERTVDLHLVYRQRAQVGERRESDAEVVEGEATPELRQSLHPVPRPYQ